MGDLKKNAASPLMDIIRQLGKSLHSIVAVHPCLARLHGPAVAAYESESGDYRADILRGERRVVVDVALRRRALIVAHALKGRRTDYPVGKR
jgi:hypothetical protein